MFTTEKNFRRGLARLSASLHSSQDEQFLIVPEPQISWGEYLHLVCSLKIAQDNLDQLVSNTNLLAAELCRAVKTEGQDV
jgi:hypothetical protein